MKETKVDIISPEWCNISSVSYILDQETKDEILKAVETLKANPDLSSVVLDGWRIESSLKEYDSDIDDPDAEECNQDDMEYFRTEHPEIIISKYYHGVVWYRAWGKYDGSAYYEFEVPVE